MGACLLHVKTVIDHKESSMRKSCQQSFFLCAANVSVDLLQVSVWRDESNVDQFDTNLDQFDTAKSISHFNARIKFYATLLSPSDTFILSQPSPLQTET